MPVIEERGRCKAPAREVWKLLHDPARIPEWFGGEDDRVVPGGDEIVVHTPTEPHPLPHAVDPRPAESRVRFACLTSGITFDWRLWPQPSGCALAVRVEIPESWAHYIKPERDLVRAQIRRLARAAEGSG